jgi:hypothetical protein
MSPDPFGWNVRIVTDEPELWQRDLFRLHVWRHHGYDETAEMLTEDGTYVRVPINETPPARTGLLLPDGALAGLRDATAKAAAPLPAQATVDELRAALDIERARVDCTLAALLAARPAPTEAP